MKLKKRGVGKKYICMVMLAAVIVSGLTACQGAKEDENSSLQSSEQGSVNIGNSEEESIVSSEGSQEQAVSPYIGEIAAIEGNTITVNVMNRGGFQAGMPEGFEPGEMPEGFEDGERPEGFEPGEIPEGFGDGNMPDMSQMPEGFEPGKMPEEFEGTEVPGGETKVIEVTDGTKIMVGESEGTISDLKVGDFIQYSMDGDTVISIISGMPQQNMPQPQSGQDGSAE